MQTRFFGQYLTFKVLFHVPMVFLCKFGENPPTGSGDSVQTRLIFIVIIVWWPWKWDQGNQNWRNFKPSQRYNIWSLARIRHLIEEIGCRQAFLSKFENFTVFNPPIGSGSRVQTMSNADAGSAPKTICTPHTHTHTPSLLRLGDINKEYMSIH